MDKLISLIIPIYNEQDNIPVLYQSLLRAWSHVTCGYDYEFIFVNDGSSDHSQERLDQLAARDPKVKVIEFSRNFGKELATSAGLAHCRGQAALMLDADLQHPPALIPQFLAEWEKGCDVVIGVREKNKGEGLIKRVGSAIFYRVMNRISTTKIVPRSTDFRLIDRRVIDEFNRFTEHNRITRGLIDWLGFRQGYIYFNAGERRFGTAAYGTMKLVKLFLSSVVSHSLFPLRLAGYIGVCITFVSGLLGAFIIVEKYILNDPLHFGFSGPATLAVIILFLVGIILSCLGLIALYIAAIHGEVINRPMFVIRDKKNL